MGRRRSDGIIGYLGRSVVVLCSSGLDSMILMSLCLVAGKEVHPLFVHSGFPWEDAERRALKRILAKVVHRGVRELSEIEVQAHAVYASSWVFSGRPPRWEEGIASNTMLGRNVLLLSLAFMLAASRGVRAVALGIRTRSYRDSSEEFLNSMSASLNRGLGTEIVPLFPLLKPGGDGVTDPEMSALNMPWGLTFSCYNPGRGDQPCGSCYKCRENAVKRKRLGL